MSLPEDPSDFERLIGPGRRPNPTLKSLGPVVAAIAVLVAIGLVVVSTVFLVVLLVGAVSIERGVIERGPSDSSALRILEERFARGEIDRDEFEERRAALRS